MGMWNCAANSSWLNPSALRITFTCGVRFIRLRSSDVSGFASGSAIAAAWRSASVMASKRVQSISDRVRRFGAFFVIDTLLIRFGSSRRDDADSVVANGVYHEQQAASAIP